MNLIYPQGPDSVPADLVRPGRVYKHKAWSAVAALVLFIALYLGLTVWFITTAIHRYQALGDRTGPLEYIVFLCSVFLAAFLIKALFFVRKGASANDAMEVTRAQQPQLFAFLDRVADEARAPRPHKVFLSQRVNAAVFYDLSLLNLIFPSRKNLEIGLGLVNMLSLAEFKAVCAHEFGHFGQRSMAVGRWVYTTQQIAGHIVAKRDILDRWLNTLSHVDVRIAWIGWILRLIIWSLRTVVDVGFRLVVVAQRALSREMEMQADLVAVSVAGSDAIVHALHRLQVADDAWERALKFAHSEANAGRPPRDVFEIQQAIVGRLNLIFNDPDYGKRSWVPPDERTTHRLFKAQMAQPPRMWATHPMNHEREENAKRTYVFAPEDDRSAWELFTDAQALRERTTRTLVADQEHAPVGSEVTLDRLDELFTQERLKPCYRGLYVNLSPTRHAATVDVLYDEDVQQDLLDSERLYPPSIVADLAKWQELERELAQLDALREGTYVAADGVIRHRGQIIQRRQLGHAIAEVDAERVAARSVLEGVLRNIRSQHLIYAKQHSPAWHAHLRGMLRVLHYANHAEANLRDANNAMQQCLYRVLGKASPRDEDVQSVVLAAGAVLNVLERTFQDAEFVHPDKRVLAEFGVDSWATALGELKLGVPSRENINDWLKYVDSWVAHAGGRLELLGWLTLNQLLCDEAMLATASRGGSLDDAPSEALTVPPLYNTLVVGTERVLPHDKGNLWDRFRNAQGLVPSVGRAVVALCVVGAALTVGSSVDNAQVIVYNDLAQTVLVTIDGQRIEVGPESHAQVSLPGSREVSVSATTKAGESIESFQGSIRRKDKFLIYTVAGAGPVRAWNATYGSARTTAPELLAPQQWRHADADYVFTEPPERLRAVGAAVKSVLDAPKDWSPEDQVRGLQDKASAAAMVLAHVRYDAPDSHNLEDWLSLAVGMPGFEQAFAARLARYPHDIVARRIEQSITKGADHELVCTRQRAVASAEPDNGDLAYLAIRCMPEGSAKVDAMRTAYSRWPRSAWLANAVAWDEMEAGRYSDAEAALNLAMQSSELLRQTRAVDNLRLLRLRDPGAAMSRLEGLERVNIDVRRLAAFEPRHSMPDDGVDRAVALLANGRLEEAVTAAQDTPVAAYVLRMAAASDGASSALRARAKALGADVGISTHSVWLALADGVPANSPAIKQVLEGVATQSSRPDDIAKVQNFVTLARSGNVDGAERALHGPIHPVLRAEAYVTGVY